MAKDKFVYRHIGPRDSQIDDMLKKIGADSVDALMEETIPSNIRIEEPLNLPEAISEDEYLALIKGIASKNKLYRTYIGQGYNDTITPAVIIRNILENPTWYTSYTPYQAEISQGRLEALLNYQTMVMDLTKMTLTNCSLLDEGTAAAESMLMMLNLRSRAAKKAGANQIFVDENTFTQTIDVLNTRAVPYGIELVFGDYKTFEFTEKVIGAIVQYPAADGTINDYEAFVAKAHENGALVAVGADLMSLALIKAPGDWDADIVFGTTQRFGVPMGYGGPHAGYLACREEYKRQIPGRIIGVTVDSQGNKALRLSLQTREQHIKREKASSNICTAQALLATMAGFYGVYHGAEGIKRIASEIHASAGFIASELKKLGLVVKNDNFFDTVTIELPTGVSTEKVQEIALAKEINFYYNENCIGISTNEKVGAQDVKDIVNIFAEALGKEAVEINEIPSETYFNASHTRESEYLTLDVFNRYRSETALMRYANQLSKRDIALNDSMISLGSCTMKLNAAAEMLPISWPEFGGLHPFIPVDQAQGYHQLITELEDLLAVVTGFAGCSLQPNSGAAGEYTGLMVIRQYHIDRGDAHRDVVLIPASAHGTNPATCSMSGNKVVIVDCDEKGNVDVEDLRAKAEKYKDNLNAYMVTYPSTHGVFEASIKEQMDIIHDNGGLVYMDGANMNAQVGFTNPGTIDADVCHLNLHKTFAIPHGGGGPGIGPICVNEKLVDFLPGHKLVKTGGSKAIGAVSAAPFGSISVASITYGYIRMLGFEGLKKATAMAILNANYLASSFKDMGYKILYTGETGRVAHEMIFDCREFKKTVGITDADIAKRLMDYGFHAPTLSFPVHGTLMIEPTESEPKEELDRFIEALASINQEIKEIEQGIADTEDNVLKNAPHTASMVISSEWNHSYSREKAAFPLKWTKENKFWTYCSRVDDGYGDKNLMCSCEPIDSYRMDVFDLDK